MDGGQQLRVVVVGDTRVGKSCLACSFECGHWMEAQPWYGSLAQMPIPSRVVEGVCVQLWEAWSNAEERQRCLAYAGADLFVVCFHARGGGRTSLGSVCGRWMEEIKRHASDRVPVVLLGLRSDCAEESVMRRAMRDALVCTMLCLNRRKGIPRPVVLMIAEYVLNTPEEWAERTPCVSLAEVERVAKAHKSIVACAVGSCKTNFAPLEEAILRGVQAVLHKEERRACQVQ